MQIEIITIGNEVLSGRTFDTNFAQIARALEEVNVQVGWHTTVGDTVERIGEALRLALSRADAVVMTGGLGPTPDDPAPNRARIARWRRWVDEGRRGSSLCGWRSSPLRS